MDTIKAIKQILDNPANDLTITSRDILQTVVTNLELRYEDDKPPTLQQLSHVFGDFENRYNSDAVFNKVIKAIATGGNVLEQLDQVLMIQKRQAGLLASKMLQSHLFHNHQPDEEE
jgi:hypothetical protein